MKRASTIVAISLAAAAIALLIPALWRLNQAKCLTQCTINLRRLGLVLQNYHSFTGKFPLAITKPPVELPIEKCISWWAEIDPYIESAPRLRIDLRKPWDAEENRVEADRWCSIARCPANTQSSFSPLDNSYVAILGLGTNSGTMAIDSPARGVFSFRDHTTLDDIKDGKSTTLVFAETVHRNGRALGGGYPTARWLDPHGPPYLGQTGQFGSFHQGKSNIAFADGSVRSLKDSLSPRIFEALSTIAGGEKIDSLTRD